MRRCAYIWFVLMLCTWCSAQTMVYLEHSNTLSFDEQRLPDAQILKGNVVFRHDSAWMYCDSAYFYEKDNSIDAFGHIRFEQGDTLFGYGDKLFYNGNTRLARLCRNVRLVHNSTILTTDSLNYNRTSNLAYYFTGGTIRDSLNTLTSIWGQYSTSTYKAFFRDSVRLLNDRFTLTSNTLHYNTQTHIADIVSPTEIIYEKETTIHTSKGWYNTATEHSMLLDRSLIVHNDGKTMTGDTIFYDKKQGFGQALQQIALTDSAQKATLYGNYGEMYEQHSRGFVTDSALWVNWADSDWVYVHADTIYTCEIPYQKDSLTDTIYHFLRAHYGVRMYSIDLQAKCDSMTYTDNDSIVRLFTEPVCWNENSQISADQIDIYLKDSTIDHIVGTANALAIQQETDDYYNQLSGKEMTAYMRNGELEHVVVDGNARTIYYPTDKGEYIGMNTSESSSVTIFVEDNTIERVLFLNQPQGTIYPLDQVPDGADRLAAFFWADDERPKLPGDVFLKPQRKQKNN